MAIQNATWRSHPFEVRRVYIARESFIGHGNSRFDMGSEYMLTSISYSHYDSCTVFAFKNLATSDAIAWWWGDEEPYSFCNERFSIANEQGNFG